MLKAPSGYTDPFGIDSFQNKFASWSIWYGIIVPNPFVNTLEFDSTSTAQHPLCCHPTKWEKWMATEQPISIILYVFLFLHSFDDILRRLHG